MTTAVIITVLLVLALLLSGIELFRSHGQSLTAWACLILSVALILQGGLLG